MVNKNNGNLSSLSVGHLQHQKQQQQQGQHLKQKRRQGKQKVSKEKSELQKNVLERNYSHDFIPTLQIELFAQVEQRAVVHCN